MPLMAKHKVFTMPNVIDSKTEERKTSKGGNLIYRILTIEYTFYAEDGSNVKAVVIGEGMDSGDKAANKAMSVAHKYALFQALCIATKEDPDKESADSSEALYTGAARQKQSLAALFRNHGVTDQSKKKELSEVMMGQPMSKLESIIKTNVGVD
jgi:hypothetical protein